MSSHDGAFRAEVPLVRSSLALSVIAVACSLPCVAASHHAAAKAHAVSSHAVPRHGAASHGAASHYRAVRGSEGAKGRHAQRVAAVHHEAAPAMDPTRATAIQTALIHAGYLSGEPSGVWDADSIAAMQKLQDANGWQTKYTPDSRALVKLGLGGAPSASAQPTVPAVATETASAAMQP